MPPTGSNAPLHAALTALTRGDILRFQMPGHHGKPIAGLEQIAGLDMTENPETGNLYEGHDIIAQAEALWASAWAMPHCQFLTGGSTQGIYAAFLAACRPGDRVLVDRACHRSVFHAMALLDLSPVYLIRDMETPITAEQVCARLRECPGVKAVCITSPTYYGVLSEIPEIDGTTVIVDGAHGAHLPFLGTNPFHGAGLVAVSAHKTLPALGQAALLFSGGTISADELRRAAALAGTSSPSYPILVSLDLARAYMEGAGADECRRVIARAEALRREFPSLSGPRIDPMRLTLRVGDGFAVESALRRIGIWPEMADLHHVVLLLSPVDTDADLDRLTAALRAIPAAGVPAPDRFPAPPGGEQAVSVRAALLGDRDRCRLADAEGRIAASAIAPYPPGVPVLAPGERVTKKHLAYLSEIGYNGNRMVEVRKEPEG